MSLFKKILTVISYVSVAGGPILAATGVGVPIGAALGAVGVASGAWLHFLDSPRSSSDVAAAAAATINATKTVEAAVKKP